MAQITIRLFTRSIQRDIDSSGPVFPEKIRPVLIYERSICIDRHDHPQSAKFLIQGTKLRVKERLSACQQHEQRTCFHHLTRDIKPFIQSTKPPLCFHLLPAHPDITHVTVHVAEREKLQDAVEGDLFLFSMCK